LLAAYRESTALGVCEPTRSGTQLLAENAILLSERVDQIRSSWWRFTQPATVSMRNCSASGIARGYSAEMASD